MVWVSAAHARVCGGRFYEPTRMSERAGNSPLSVWVFVIFCRGQPLRALAQAVLVREGLCLRVSALHFALHLAMPFAE